MNITSIAVAGTLESSDIYVEVEPCEELELNIESVVLNQFGDEIRATILSVLEELGVKSGRISVQDKGAIDCTIRARVETAVRRAGGEK